MACPEVLAGWFFPGCLGLGVITGTIATCVGMMVALGEPDPKERSSEGTPLTAPPEQVVAEIMRRSGSNPSPSPSPRPSEEDKYSTPAITSITCSPRTSLPHSLLTH